MEQNTRKKSPVVRFLVLGGLGLLVLLGLILYWQKDRLIGAVVSQVNERLNTRVDVGSVDVTLLRTFPRLAVGFERVTVFESCCGKKDTLARIQHVQFYLSVWKALGGTYQIEGLAVKKGFVRLRQMANGTVNYDIFKKDTAVARSAPSGKKPVPFQLEKTHLEQIEFRYQKEGSFMVSQFIDKLEADYTLLAGRSTLAAKGKVLVHKLSTASQTLMQKMPMGIDVTLALAPTKDGTELTLTNALIDMDGAAFRLNGKVLAAEKPLYNVQLTAEKSDLKTLAAFMPPTARQALAAYKSSGRINLTLTAEKKNPDTKYPRLDVTAQAQSAGFRHNRLPLTFAGVAFRGSFTLPEGNTLAAARLRVPTLRGALNGRPFEGAVEATNLEAPKAKGHFRGALPLAVFEEPLRLNNITGPAGLVEADLHFNTEPKRAAQVEGTVQLNDIAFNAGQRKLPFRQWHGKLSLTSKAIDAVGVKGFVGQSDLIVNGRLVGFLDYLTGNKPQLTVEADILSTYLNLDQILASDAEGVRETAAPTTRPTEAALAEEDYRLVMARHLTLNARLEVSRFQFRRFGARQLRARMRVKNQQAEVDQVRMLIADGQAFGKMALDARQPARIFNQIEFEANGVQMDSLLYSLENVGQNYLTDKHIGGTLHAKGNLSLEMNQKLEVNPRSVAAYVDVKIERGMLRNFEPVNVLGKYIDKDELKLLRFETIKNQFSYQNEVLSIPSMDISSNALSATVAGTHDLNRGMDYRLKIPLLSLKAGSGILKTASRVNMLQGNLFLKISGMPGRLRVDLDTRSTGEKILTDLKKEKKEFLDLFKKKENQTEADKPPTEKDEPAYFDFD